MMSDEKIFLVIPTIRDLTFLEVWQDQFEKTHLVVVEDHQEQQIQTPTGPFASVVHYTHQDIKSDLGKDEWIIGRKNSGIRNYGFWKAYQKGASVILTLDDDCYPTGSDFVETHVSNLNFRGASNWVATYPDPEWMYTRGFPYTIRDKQRVVVSHGLWSGALDLDGRTERQLPTLLDKSPYPPIRQIIPRSYYYPMCSMNLAFRREITPAMFFPMMGLNNLDQPWGFDRFDDIWSGILSKKIIDHLGWSVINGSPIVEHRKRSLPGDNYMKEKSGIKLNEEFWRWVDVVELTSLNPQECYRELAKKTVFPETKYFNALRQAMGLWADLF